MEAPYCCKRTNVNSAFNLGNLLIIKPFDTSGIKKLLCFIKLSHGLVNGSITVDDSITVFLKLDVLLSPELRKLHSYLGLLP